MFPADLTGSWRRVWIVALREIRERGGSVSYRVSTAVALAAVVALILVPSLLSPAKTYHVGMTGAVPAGTATALATQVHAAGREVAIRRYATLAEGEDAVRDKKVNVLIVEASRLEWRTKADSTLGAAIANAVQAAHIREQARHLAISAGQVSRLLTPVRLDSRTIGSAHTSDPAANAVAFLAVGALYVAISFYAGFVLAGVVQEKANRVAEVLLARMPAREILAGKVLGIGAVGLGQFAVLGIAAGVTAQLVKGAGAPHISAGVLALTVAWFVVGYLFYSVAYAAVGATTSRIEDAQSAITPIYGLMLLSYLGVIYAEENPDAPLTLALSYFPPTAPIVMTYWVATNAAPGWQILTAASVMAAAIWGLIRVAGRVYSGGLLRVGGRVALRDVWRSTRA